MSDAQVQRFVSELYQRLQVPEPGGAQSQSLYEWLRQKIHEEEGRYYQERIESRLDAELRNYFRTVLFPFSNRMETDEVERSLVSQWVAQALGFAEFPPPWSFVAQVSKRVHSPERLSFFAGEDAHFEIGSTSTGEPVRVSPRVAECVILPLSEEAGNGRGVETRHVRSDVLQLGLALGVSPASLAEGGAGGSGPPLLLYINPDATHIRDFAKYVDRLRVGRWYPGRHVDLAARVSYRVRSPNTFLSVHGQQGEDPAWQNLVDWRRLSQFSRDVFSQRFIEVPYEIWSRLEKHGDFYWVTIDVGDGADSIAAMLSEGLELNCAVFWNVQYFRRDSGLAQGTLLQKDANTVVVRRLTNLRDMGRLPLVLSVFDSDSKVCFYNRRYSLGSDPQLTFTVSPPGDLARDMAELHFGCDIKANRISYEFLLHLGEDYFTSADPAFAKTRIYHCAGTRLADDACQFHPITSAEQPTPFEGLRQQVGTAVFDELLHYVQRPVCSRTDMERLIRRNPVRELREMILPCPMRFDAEYGREAGALVPLIRITCDVAARENSAAQKLAEFYREWLEGFIQDRAATGYQVRIRFNAV